MRRAAGSGAFFGGLPELDLPVTCSEQEDKIPRIASPGARQAAESAGDLEPRSQFAWPYMVWMPRSVRGRGRHDPANTHSSNRPERTVHKLQRYSSVETCGQGCRECIEEEE